MSLTAGQETARLTALPGRTMGEDDADFTRMDDPEFLDERARIRELLERLPLDHDDYGRLAARYRAMQEEFFRRAFARSQEGGETQADG